MKVITSLDDPAFPALFQNFEHTAYRLETLQSYDVGYEDERYRDFRDGKTAYVDDASTEWCEMIRRHRSNGRTMARVHVVVEPLSEYLRYEILWPYRENVAAGEDIRILPTPDGEWPADLPRRDYWLFDSREALEMRYDSSGAFIAAETVEEPQDIVQFNFWRDLALHKAMPYDRYVATRGDFLKR